MRIRVLLGTAIAGFVIIALAGCQGDTTGPDPLAPGSELFAKGTPGPPDGGGGGGGGGKPPTQGDMYSDLVYLYRDVNGLPFISRWVVVDDDPEETAYDCVRPVSYEPLELLGAVTEIREETNPVNGRHVWLIPLAGDFLESEPAGAIEVLARPTSPEEEETTELAPCDPYGEFDENGTLVFSYGDAAEEVPFGRLNMGRSPDRVLDQALREVTVKLVAWYDGGSGPLKHDHAGRFTNYTDETADSYSTIDSPGENLAIHRELQLAWDSWLPWLPAHPGSRAYTGTMEGVTPGVLENAASGLGAAADKGGYVSEDMIVYNNRILEIPETDALPTLEPQVGVVGEAGQKYIDYSGFSYKRSETFPGCLYGWEYEGGVPRSIEGSVIDLVFGGEDFDGVNINAFAQRADDARAVIQFEHDNEVIHISPIGTILFCGMDWPPTT